MITAMSSTFLVRKALHSFHDMAHQLSGFKYQTLGNPAWTLLMTVLSKLECLFPVHLALYCYVSALIATILMLHQRLSRRLAMQCPSGHEAYSYIHALTKLMVPTRSIWPPNYVDSRSWVDTRYRTANLSVVTLFRDVIQGRVELRRPVHNLPLLIKEPLRLHGWSFRLSVGLEDRMKMLVWTFWEKMVFGGDVDVLERSTLGEDIISPAERSLLLNFCLAHCSDIPTQLTHGTRRYNSRILDWLKQSEGGDALNIIKANEKVHIWPYVDFLPLRLMEPFLLSLKKKTSVGPLRQSVLTFTTCESSLSVLSKEYVLAALLYVRKPRTKAQARRTFTPLRAKLHRILALLTSGRDSLNILVTQNSSSEYAQELNEYAERLEYDPEERTGFIKTSGIQAWREERLYARWEAALLTAGLLTRWIVLVEPKNKEKKT